MSEIRNFGTPNLVLAGKTIDVRAGTTYPAPLHDDRSLSRLSQMPGKIFPAFTTSDDDVLITLDAHFVILLTKSRLERRSKQISRRTQIANSKS
jgi:hypothetical protein